MGCVKMLTFRVDKCEDFTKAIFELNLITYNVVVRLLLLYVASPKTRTKLIKSGLNILIIRL